MERLKGLRASLCLLACLRACFSLIFSFFSLFFCPSLMKLVSLLSGLPPLLRFTQARARSILPSARTCATRTRSQAPTAGRSTERPVHRKPSRGAAPRSSPNRRKEPFAMVLVTTPRKVPAWTYSLCSRRALPSHFLLGDRAVASPRGATGGPPRCSSSPRPSSLPSAEPRRP